MKKKMSIATIFLIVGQFCNQNNAFGQISLYYEEFGVFFYPKRQVDTLNFEVSQNYPGCTLKIFLKDFGGESYIELYDRKHHLKMTGSFVNGPDTLIRYRYSKQLGPPFDKKYTGILKVKYLSPLKKGIWTFYDNGGKVIAKDDYDFHFL